VNAFEAPGVEAELRCWIQNWQATVSNSESPVDCGCPPQSGRIDIWFQFNKAGLLGILHRLVIHRLYDATVHILVVQRIDLCGFACHVR
jgi:hypothetical protein